MNSTTAITNVLLKDFKKVLFQFGRSKGFVLYISLISIFDMQAAFVLRWYLRSLGSIFMIKAWMKISWGVGVQKCVNISIGSH